MRYLIQIARYAWPAPYTLTGIAIGLLLFGLMIWLFYQSLETLTTAEFPNDLRLYLF